jgi:hypothetical protein
MYAKWKSRETVLVGHRFGWFVLKGKIRFNLNKGVVSRKEDTE